MPEKQDGICYYICKRALSPGKHLAVASSLLSFSVSFLSPSLSLPPSLPLPLRCLSCHHCDTTVMVRCDMRSLPLFWSPMPPPSADDALPLSLSFFLLFSQSLFPSVSFYLSCSLSLSVPLLRNLNVPFGRSMRPSHAGSDIFFGDMSLGRMNQFVPQLILGSALDSSSGPPDFKPDWHTHTTWAFGAHYFFEILNQTTGQPEGKAAYGRLFEAKAGETLFTSFTQKWSAKLNAPTWTLKMGAVNDPDRVSVRQLQHYFGTSYQQKTTKKHNRTRISQPYTAPTPTPTRRRGLCATECVSGADWYLQSDAVPDSSLQVVDVERPYMGLGVDWPVPTKTWAEVQ